MGFFQGIGFFLTFQIHPFQWIRILLDSVFSREMSRCGSSMGCALLSWNLNGPALANHMWACLSRQKVGLRSDLVLKLGVYKKAFLKPGMVRDCNPRTWKEQEGGV